MESKAGFFSCAKSLKLKAVFIELRNRKRRWEGQSPDEDLRGKRDWNPPLRSISWRHQNSGAFLRNAVGSAEDFAEEASRSFKNFRVDLLPLQKLRWQWKITIFKRELLPRSLTARP